MHNKQTGKKRRSCWKLAPLQPIFFLVRSSFLIRLLILSFSPPSDCPHTSLFIPQKAWVTLESHYTLRYINTNFPVAATKTTKKKKKGVVQFCTIAFSPSNNRSTKKIKKILETCGEHSHAKKADVVRSAEKKKKTKEKERETKRYPHIFFLTHQQAHHRDQKIQNGA